MVNRMVPDSPTRTDTLVREMRIRQSPSRAQWSTAAWWLLRLVALAAALFAGWRLLGTTPYRIDIDVYRMGGRAWLDGSPLYSDGVLFPTAAGLNLPFTYPPLAAAIFSPFAWMSLDAASATITAITFALLIVTTLIVLTRLRVWEQSATIAGPAWRRRSWLAVAIVAPAVILFEPVRSNFEFGQINVILMTLVIADCVPRRTPWPRGVLLGIAIALKLTPAVFLLYFLMRRDTRALLTTAASVALATALGFVLAWRDSWEYWTETIRDTERIGTATYLTNQNIAGTLARFGLDDTPRFVIWLVACFAVLGLTAWAVRQVLRKDQRVLALICVAMFGLVVSPVSWSHHWVWALPAVLVTAVLAYRYRDLAMGAVSVTGVVLMVDTPIHLMTEHEETSAALWRQLLGGSYVWWALVLIVVAGTATLKKPLSGAPAVAAAPAHAAG